VSLASTKQLNVDDSGAPLPVVVRVYQLRHKEKFDEASFKSLWKSDKDVLEGDLLERKELTLHPESEVVLELEVDRKKGADYIGVMALFRKPDGNSWRQVLSTDISHMPFSTPVVKLILDQHTVTVKVKE
jgi:type VI secretion system protein VasD